MPRPASCSIHSQKGLLARHILRTSAASLGIGSVMLGRHGVDLGDLAAGGVGAPAEVGPVARRHAGLARPAAGVAADRPVPGQPLDEQPEGVAGWAHPRRSAAWWGWRRSARRVGDDLGELAAGHIVRPSGRCRRRSRRRSPAGQAADEGVERVILVHVGERDRAGRGGRRGGRRGRGAGSACSWRSRWAWRCRTAAARSAARWCWCR